MRSRSNRAGRAGLLVGVVVLVLWIPAAATASLSDLLGLLRSTPSDGRAVFHDGNVVTCAGAGFPGTIQMGSPQNHDASDANVSGVVAPNSGTIQPGQGEEVNVTLVNLLVVVDAAVVKGGNGYNVYSNPSFLPPTLGPPQHYISPFNGGGNVPTISHWFVCYHLTTPPPTGSIAVRKTVIAPDGVTADGVADHVHGHGDLWPTNGRCDLAWRWRCRHSRPRAVRACAGHDLHGGRGHQRVTAGHRGDL